MSDPSAGTSTQAADNSSGITLITYTEAEIQERSLADVEFLVDRSAQSGQVTWLNVDEADQPQLIHAIGHHLRLHPLAVEDVLHVRQRAKVEEYDGYLYIVVRMASMVEGELTTEQLSIFLFPGLVVTIQEGVPGDCLEPIRARLRHTGSNLRRLGADYLAYGIIDAAIDSYFGPLQDFGEQLDELEEAIDETEPLNAESHLHNLRRNLLAVRRAVWPLRDAIGGLMRNGHPLIQPETQVHLRDCVDHTFQLAELAESYREVCADLREVQFAKLTQRTNDVMRVLTVIATIFMPLSFIAGVYGMNFNTTISSANMPELNWAYGYPFALMLMGLICCSMLVLFWHWGWVGPRKTV